LALSHFPIAQAQSGGSERRSEPRFEADHASLTARVNGTRALLIDVSRNGLALGIPPEATNPSQRMLAVELEQNGVLIAKLGLRVTHVAPHGEHNVLGGRIQTAEVVPSGRPPLPLPGDVVEIRDPTLRASVLERMLERPSLATVRLESGTSLEGTLSRADSERDALALVLADASDLTGQFVSVEVPLFESRFVVEATIERQTGAERVLSSPHRVLSLCRRLSERVPLSPGAGVVSWNDVMDPDRNEQATVLDVSPNGIAIELAPNQLLPPPPIAVTVRLGTLRLRALAEVHRVAVRQSGTSVVGLSIKTLRPADALRLAQFCDSVRFPNLIRRREADAGAVAELMRASGYLALRDGTGPDHEWHESPGDEALAIDSVFRSDAGAVVGHLSCSRVYPKTWMMHQLATVGLRRDRIAYPLYIQLMGWIALLAENEGYALAYFDQHLAWHQTLLGSLVRWTGSEALSVVALLDRFEPSGGGDQAFAVPDTIVVREARPADLPFAVRLARAQLPPLVSDALHLHADAISTENLCNEHTALGLERARTTFVVESQGEMLGAAICETGANRLSLFNILNMAHVFFREPVSPIVGRPAQAALLRRVLDFYRARQRAQPLIVSPAGNARFASGAGLVRAETMGLWTASLGGVKQWRNFIHFSLGGLAHRRRSQIPSAA
jgi:hypothetical protein